MKRISELSGTDRTKIYRLISLGRLTKYIDEEGYVCYDEKELEKDKGIKRKVGRPAKNGIKI